jgi:hypothetical protein
MLEEEKALLRESLNIIREKNRNLVVTERPQTRNLEYDGQKRFHFPYCGRKLIFAHFFVDPSGQSLHFSTWPFFRPYSELVGANCKCSDLI